MSHPKPAAPSPEQFLANFPAAIQALAGELRSLIAQTIPGVIEAVYPGWHLIGYRVRDGKRARYFGLVAPFADHVKLGFEYGALLHDERGLLVGGGKQLRYVVLRPGDALPSAALAALIAEAAMVAATIRR